MKLTNAAKKFRRNPAMMIVAGPAVAARQDPPAPQPPHVEQSLEEYRQKMADVHARAEAITAAAAAEHRVATDEEQAELDALTAQFDTYDREVQKLEKILAQREKLAQPQRRISQPAEPVAATAALEASQPQRARVTGGDLVGASKNTHGFRSMGEYAKAVIGASRGHHDPRLVAAATTYGSEGTNADGGYAVPPDFRETIVRQIQGEEALLPRTDQQQTSSNKITVPIDAGTPWATSGGIQGSWLAEGAAKPASKPALGQMEVKAYKLAALVPVTDELLEDVPSLSRYLPSKVADKFTSMINDAIINGDGSGKPQGLLNSGSKITVAKETGQAADTLVFENVIKMWSRLYAPLRAGAVWIMNQDVEPQLFGMMMPGDTIPAYLPPNGLSGNPFATLFGRPIIPSESAQALGDEGDIILTNLNQYLTVVKSGGIKSDVSMHLYFDQDITTFRFVIRIGGQSWWSAPAAKRNGSNTLSNIVTLAARA